MTIVRGTQKEKPLALEFSKDTVYERSSIERVEEPGVGGRRGFSGWEYVETRYTYPEYAAKQQQEADNIKLALAELAELSAGG
jgi:hypothetical protein